MVDHAAALIFLHVVGLTIGAIALVWPILDDECCE